MKKICCVLRLPTGVLFVVFEIPTRVLWSNFDTYGRDHLSTFQNTPKSLTKVPPFETFRFPLRTLKISQIHLVQDPPRECSLIAPTFISEWNFGTKFCQNFTPRWKLVIIASNLPGGSWTRWIWEIFKVLRGNRKVSKGLEKSLKSTY